MTQTPMTTREAVQTLIEFVQIEFGSEPPKFSMEYRACAALCEAYNFNLSDFFATTQEA